MPSLSLLGRCAQRKVAKIELPHWQNLALELLLSFKLCLLQLLLLKCELINLIIV
jgi:uncharacterized protein (DUF983 family)